MRTDDVTALIRDVAERVVLPRFRSLDDADVEEKTPGDPVTIADREAEVELTRALLAAHPGVLVVGEEASFADPTLVTRLPGADHAFVVDPVDGTRNFAGGSSNFGVMVAEVRRGVTVRSWIWQPRHDQMFVAELGAGATRNGERLVSAPGRRPPYLTAVYGAMKKTTHPAIRVTHRLGACAIDYPRVVTGELDAVAYYKLHPWDHLPGALLVAEAGGFVGVHGHPFVAGVTTGQLFGAASREVYDVVDAALRPR